MIAAPGTTAWLLEHELRLDWRRRTERRGVGRYVAILVTLIVPLFLGVFVGGPAGFALRRVADPVNPVSMSIAALALFAAWTLMFSQALAAVVEALYERSDLDLLFASPIPPERVITVRALAIAFGAFSVFGYFFSGPIVVIALLAGLNWLLGIPVLFALALAATGVALMTSLGLLRVLGPKRTRLAAHVLSAVAGGFLFLASQASNILGAGETHSLYQRIGDWAAAPGFHEPPLLSWGLRALMGEPAPFLVLVAAGVAVFAAAIAVVGPRFASGVARAAGADVRRGRLTRGGAFAAGAFAATYRKELRLLLRDPMLVPQVVLRVVYLVPLAFVTVRFGASADFTALSGALLAMVLMANQVTGSLAWLTVSAEDARDLVFAAPAPPVAVDAAKLAAAATPAAVVLAPAVAYLLVTRPTAGVIGLVACASALASAGLVNLRWQKPTRRTALRTRRNSPWFVTLIELAIGLLIAFAAGLLVQEQVVGWGLAAIAAVCVAGLATTLWRPRRFDER